MKIKIEVEMSERDAKDLDTVITQIQQVCGLAINTNGLLQLDKVRNAIIDAIITPTEIEIEDTLLEGKLNMKEKERNEKEELMSLCCDENDVHDCGLCPYEFTDTCLQNLEKIRKEIDDLQ